jgi:hypothetical protein
MGIIKRKLVKMSSPSKKVPNIQENIIELKNTLIKINNTELKKFEGKIKDYSNDELIKICEKSFEELSFEEKIAFFLKAVQVNNNIKPTNSFKDINNAYMIPNAFENDSSKISTQLSFNKDLSKLDIPFSKGKSGYKDIFDAVDALMKIKAKNLIKKGINSPLKVDDFKEINDKLKIFKDNLEPILKEFYNTLFKIDIGFFTKCFDADFFKEKNLKQFFLPEFSKKLIELSNKILIVDKILMQLYKYATQGVDDALQINIIPSKIYIVKNSGDYSFVLNPPVNEFIQEQDLIKLKLSDFAKDLDNSKPANDNNIIYFKSILIRIQEWGKL